jgi:hypothetical protein
MVADVGSRVQVNRDGRIGKVVRADWFGHLSTCVEFADGTVDEIEDSELTVLPQTVPALQKG